MFKASNAYDEVVIKATDENLTSENWELNLDVCDRVTTEGEAGARNCVAALLKRLVHRNANVQLYALTLADALSKNCGLVAHRELASRSFCQTLQRIVTDRNTHSTVKNKALKLIKEWSTEWGQDETLGIVRETMDSLKSQGFIYEEQPVEPPADPSSEQLRAEDEELRRVLELSLQDQGGRGVEPSTAATTSAAVSAPAASTAQLRTGASAGVDKGLPDPNQHSSFSTQHTRTSTASAPPQPANAAASRVRALYDFQPSEEGELGFQKGDVIRVLDSVYEHWWRGELRGQAGIFPVNYVEILPDPSPADIQREAEMEASIFAQANDIDRLLSKLRGLDPARDNLAEDEELQELYQSSLSMRPKIVRLIDRYNLKVSELRTMNEKFVRARSTYDGMMQQSLHKHTTPHAPHDPSYAAQQGYGPPQPHQQPVQPSQPQSQEYAQDWAQWYAQQGHHPQAAYASETPQLPPGAPPYDSPEYAEWYYAQQQHAQPPQHTATLASNPPTAPQPEHEEDEKKRMFERARAEAEAYHRAHQQHSSDAPSAPPA